MLRRLPLLVLFLTVASGCLQVPLASSDKNKPAGKLTTKNQSLAGTSWGLCWKDMYDSKEWPFDKDQMGHTLLVFYDDTYSLTKTKSDGINCGEDVTNETFSITHRYSIGKSLGEFQEITSEMFSGLVGFHTDEAVAVANSEQRWEFNDWELRSYKEVIGRKEGKDSSEEFRFQPQTATGKFRVENNLLYLDRALDGADGLGLVFPFKQIK